MTAGSFGHCLTDNGAPTLTLDLRGSFVWARWREGRCMVTEQERGQGSWD